MYLNVGLKAKHILWSVDFQISSRAEQVIYLYFHKGINHPNNKFQALSPLIPVKEDTFETSLPDTLIECVFTCDWLI